MFESLKRGAMALFPRAYLRIRDRIHGGTAPLTRGVVHRVRSRVVAGPFAGMKYLPAAAGSALLPKLLGTYEAELHCIIAEATRRNYEGVVDIGCAEGYYAVGLARALSQTPVYAFDTDDWARRLCRSMAKINGVADRVQVLGECVPETLLAMADQRILAICDCEGYEASLITEDLARRLAKWDILIETHETEAPHITEKLAALFASSHDIQVVLQRPRDATGFPSVMALPESWRQAAMEEGRHGVQHWLWASAKNPSPRFPE